MLKHALPVLLLMLAVTGCNDPVRRVSESSLRNATARGAAEELRGLGYPLKGELRCRTLSADTLSVVRVECFGQTTRQQPVRVEAVAYEAESAQPRQDFVITVGGRRVLHAPCLAQGCRDGT